MELIGLGGARTFWRDFFEAWESIRSHTEDVIASGDRVLVLGRQFGRMRGVQNEVELAGAAIYSVSGGMVVRAEFYADRGAALEAAGLAD